MNNIAPSAAKAILASGAIDSLLGGAILASRFGFLPWDFAEMFAIPGNVLTIIGAILLLSGLGMMAWMVTILNNAPME